MSRLKTNTRVYLAGPMTGIPKWNAPAFDEAAAILRQEGYIVINPMEVDRVLDGFDPDNSPYAGSYKHYMLRDLPLVMSCDEICMLPDWGKSKGANLELHTALVCDMPAWYFKTRRKVETLFCTL